MAQKEICAVLENQTLADGICSLTLRAPQTAAAAAAGQFVHIACGEGNVLRRPISICDARQDTLRVVFQIKGEGTAWLAARRAGDEIDLLGPLGHGYDLTKLGTRPLLIGGGIGVPPMLYLMKQTIAHGAKPFAILGFRTKRAVILEKEFDCATAVCTDDGTYGTHGFVTDLMREQIAGASAVCACGPKPMLRGIAEIAAAQDTPCFVSLEERMGCGIGACLVCACALQSESGETRYGHVCKDGPVFNAKEVQF